MYLRINLLGPGPRLIKKRIYRAAVSQRLRNTTLVDSFRYSYRKSSSKISCDKLNMKIRVNAQNAQKNEKSDVVTAKLINISVFYIN
jgi:hypothetical protein